MRSLFRRENRLSLIVVLPFAAFVGLFLVYPTVVVLYKALTPGGSLGIDALKRALSGTYRDGFINSIAISAMFWAPVGARAFLRPASQKKPTTISKAIT